MNHLPPVEPSPVTTEAREDLNYVEVVKSGYLHRDTCPRIIDAPVIPCPELKGLYWAEIQANRPPRRAHLLCVDRGAYLRSLNEYHRRRKEAAD